MWVRITSSTVAGSTPSRDRESIGSRSNVRPRLVPLLAGKAISLTHARAALGPFFAGEADIDHHGAVCIPGKPHEVIHRHRSIVRIAADEVLVALRFAGGVAEGKQF